MNFCSIRLWNEYEGVFPGRAWGIVNLFEVLFKTTLHDVLQETSFYDRRNGGTRLVIEAQDAVREHHGLMLVCYL